MSAYLTLKIIDLLQQPELEVPILLFILGDVTNRLAQLLAFATATVTLRLLWSAHITTYAKIARVQAFILAELFLLIALSQSEITSFLIALWTTVIRGIIIPWICIQSIQQHPEPGYNQVRLHPTIVFLIAGIFIIIGYHLLGPLTAIVPTKLAVSSPLAFAGILIGILQLTLSRSQSAHIPVMLIIMNNCLLFSLLITPTVSWIMAANLCFDLLLTTIIHPMILRHNHNLPSKSTHTNYSEI